MNIHPLNFETIAFDKNPPTLALFYKRDEDT